MSLIVKYIIKERRIKIVATCITVGNQPSLAKTSKTFRKRQQSLTEEILNKARSKTYHSSSRRAKNPIVNPKSQMIVIVIPK